MRAEVCDGEHDLIVVQQDDRATEVTLVGHGRKLLVSHGASHELELVHPWPFAVSADETDTHPASPLPGRVIALHVTEGQDVEAGQPLAVVEGMKMQHTVKAGRAGRVTSVLVEAGQLVDADAVLCEIEAR